jgi:hypothetical protein
MVEPDLGKSAELRLVQAAPNAGAVDDLAGTSVNAVDLQGRQKSLRRIVAGVLAGAVTLLLLAGLRAAIHRSPALDAPKSAVVASAPSIPAAAIEAPVEPRAEPAGKDTSAAVASAMTPPPKSSPRMAPQPANRKVGSRKPRKAPAGSHLL